MTDTLCTRSAGSFGTSDLAILFTNNPLELGENEMINHSNDIDMNNKDTGNSDSSNYFQNNEVRAFKSQFDEISHVLRMFENSKTNNNRSYGYGRMFSSLNHLSQRNMNVDTYTHHRSLSHPHPFQPNRQNTLKHKRSASSIADLSLNGSFHSHGHFYPVNKLGSLPSTPFSGTFAGNSYLGFMDDDLPFRLHMDDPVTPSIDNTFRLKSFRGIEINGRLGANHSRYSSDGSDSSWDMSPTSGFSSISQGSLSPPYPLPLTPSLNYSSFSSTYFPQNSLLDDDELAEKQMMLEDERRLLQIRHRQLDSFNKSYYQNCDSNLNHSPLTERPIISSTPSPTTRSATPALSRKSSFTKNLTASSHQLSRFQASQEPIGTPIKKHSRENLNSSLMSNSNPPSQSTFSLFSKSPELSLSHGKCSPLTPPNTSSNYNDGGYFESHNQSQVQSSNHSHLNFGIWPINDFQQDNSTCSVSHLKQSDYTTPPTSNYYTSSKPTGYFTRAPLLYVDECDEYNSWNDNEVFNQGFEKSFSGISSPVAISAVTNKLLPVINNDRGKWERYNKNMVMEKKLHQFHAAPNIHDNTGYAGILNGGLNAFELEVA